MNVNGAHAASVFSAQDVIQLQRGGTAHVQGESAFVVPKGKPPVQFATFQGAVNAAGDGAPSIKVMSPGSFMRALVATGGSLAQQLGRDPKKLQAELMQTWKDAKGGKAGEEAVFKRVASMAEFVHQKDVEARRHATDAAVGRRPDAAEGKQVDSIDI